jgi:hypothetical protein
MYQVYAEAYSNSETVNIISIGPNFSAPVGPPFGDGDEEDFRVQFGAGVFNKNTGVQIEEMTCNDLIFATIFDNNIKKIVAPFALKSRIEAERSRFPNPVHVEFY